LAQLRINITLLEKKGVEVLPRWPELIISSKLGSALCSSLEQLLCKWQLGQCTMGALRSARKLVSFTDYSTTFWTWDLWNRHPHLGWVGSWNCCMILGCYWGSRNVYPVNWCQRMVDSHRPIWKVQRKDWTSQFLWRHTGFWSNIRGPCIREFLNIFCTFRIYYDCQIHELAQNQWVSYFPFGQGRYSLTWYHNELLLFDACGGQPKEAVWRRT